MSNLKTYTLFVLFNLKYYFSLAKLWIGKKLGLIRSVMVMPYLGFGNENEIFFPGRVLKDKRIGLSQVTDNRWTNFKKMYKRFSSWEIPHVRVKAYFDNISQIVSTDDEGYFVFNLKLPAPTNVTSPWQEVHLELIDRVVKKQNNVSAVNRVYIESEYVKFGIISDIDDTIVPTGTARLWEMLKTTFLGNAYSRIPFPGVAALYKALSGGVTGNENNPFFYVSSSPWNLYDFLMEFLDIHGIPLGPLMLRDVGLSREHLISGSHTEHKLLQIKRILTIIRNTQFILIGDSGQNDPEIYLQVIRDFPGRVKMVYIRDVDPERSQKILKISNEIKSLGVEMMLVSNTIQATLHAVSKGWILPGDINDVVEDKKQDEVGKS